LGILVAGGLINLGTDWVIGRGILVLWFEVIVGEGI
jgi:hypothetical protein